MDERDFSEAKIGFGTVPGRNIRIIAGVGRSTPLVSCFSIYLSARLTGIR